MPDQVDTVLVPGEEVVPGLHHGATGEDGQLQSRVAIVSDHVVVNFRRRTPDSVPAVTDDPVVMHLAAKTTTGDPVLASLDAVLGRDPSVEAESCTSRDHVSSK